MRIGFMLGFYLERDKAASLLRKYVVRSLSDRIRRVFPTGNFQDRFHSGGSPDFVIQSSIEAFFKHLVYVLDVQEVLQRYQTHKTSSWRLQSGLPV